MPPRAPQIVALLACALVTVLVLPLVHEPGESTGPPRLRVEPVTLDLGRVEPGSEHEGALTWWREGSGELRRLGLVSGCGCAAWLDAPSEMPVGARGRARVALRAPTEPGPVVVVLRVVTDAPPPFDVSAVTVRAYVGTRAVVRPCSLDQGPRTLGSRTERVLGVHLPPGAGERLEADLVGWPGAVRVVAPVVRGQRGPDLVLTSEFEGPPGPREGALRVRTADAGEVVVPLRALVVTPRVSGP